MFRTKEKTRASEDVVQRIADLIRTNSYSPGSQLPGERQLARQLHVSRTTVREALRRLETMGLIETRQGLGSFVKDPTSEIVQAVLVPHLLTDRETFLKLYELREIIESEAAFRAAQRATPHDISEMKHRMEIVEARASRDDLSGTIVADVEFHRHIIAATGNDILIDLMDSIADLLHEMRRASLSIPGLRGRTVESHRTIMRAIEEGDAPAARQAMLEHLSIVRTKVDLFEPEGASPASNNNS